MTRMRPARVIPAFLAVLAVVGCSGGGKPGETIPAGGSAAPAPAPVDAAPGVAGGFLAIEPEAVHRGTAVRVSTGGGVPGGIPVEWLVNGDSVGPSLDSGRLQKGDTIQARAAVGDRVIASAVVTVRNTAPEIRRAAFVQPEHRTGKPLAVEAEGYDADGDPVRLDIVWEKNGEPAGTGDRLNVPVRQGDRLVVTITPFDGESPGRTVTLSREVRSTVIIEGRDELKGDGDVLTFRILASGDSGNPLTYSLKDAPPGMRIDPPTGRVRWELAPGTPGKIPFDVAVTDGAGAAAPARFTVTVREDDASGPR